VLPPRPVRVKAKMRTEADREAILLETVRQPVKE
jgi:hypothetical protein